MKIDNIRTSYRNGEKSILVSTRKIKLYQDLLDTGAVVEQGVVFETKYGTKEEELRLLKETGANNIQPLLPYIEYDRAYCPTKNPEETQELYDAVKKYASINESLDIRQYDSLKKKIDMFAFNMYYGQEYGSTSAKLKGLTCFLWIITGTLNAMSDKAFLSTINYITALLQIDYFELIPMIMASTISVEKKKYLLETIKKYYINPEVIDKSFKYVGLYTKFENETPSILAKSL